MKDKFLLVKGVSGLGNRILCLLTAILYARLTGRILIVDWSDHIYSNNRSNVFHSFFLCPLYSTMDKIPNTDSVRPSIWRGHLHDSAREMIVRHSEASSRYIEMWRPFSVDMSKLDYEEEILVMWSFIEEVFMLRRHFKGPHEELAKLSTKTILRKVLHENLKLHPLIQERVDRFKFRWFNEKKTIGVHVRYMDKKSRLSLIENRLKALLKSEPELQVFLATDSIEIYKAFQDKYDNVISTEKWYPASGRSMHINAESPDRLEHGIEAMVDLYLLGSCDYLILDESSSFAYVASLISNAPSSNIFNVQMGRKIPPQVRRLLWLLKIKVQRGLRRFRASH